MTVSDYFQTSAALSPRKSPPHPLNRKLDVPKNRAARLREQKNIR